MRILVLTNLYPPYYLGGYEIRCQMVMERLSERGHEVMVLTSDEGVPRSSWDPPFIPSANRGGRGGVRVWRRLCFRYTRKWGGACARYRFALREVFDNRTLKRLLPCFQPHVLSVWNMGGMAKSLLLTAQGYGAPLSYHIEDEWLLGGAGGWFPFWEKKPRTTLRVWGKAALEKMVRLTRLPTQMEPLNLKHACFVSRFQKEQYLRAGYEVQEAPVIYGGIETQRFFAPVRDNRAVPLRLLFVGRLENGKGTHTCLEALALLKQWNNANRANWAKDISLTVVGEDPLPSAPYLRFLERLLDDYGIQERVIFLGKLPREKLPDVYRAHDVLLFPSIRDEGISLTLLEAMVGGLTVIGTPTGGSAEILRDGENALTFPPGDALALARQVERLARNPALLQRLSRNGQELVLAEFTVERMVNRTDEHLMQVVGSGTRNANC